MAWNTRIVVRGKQRMSLSCSGIIDTAAADDDIL